MKTNKNLITSTYAARFFSSERTSIAAVNKNATASKERDT